MGVRLSAGGCNKVLAHAAAFEDLVGLDHFLKQFFHRAVAAIGVRMILAHQLGIASADGGLVRLGVEIERIEGALLKPPHPGVRVFGFALGAFLSGGRAVAEQIERIDETVLEILAGVLRGAAGAGAGREPPGGAMAIHVGRGMGLGRILAHALKEIPFLVVLGGVLLAEPVELGPVGRALGRARGRFRPALGMLAHLILLPRLGFGRLDADVFKFGSVFVRAVHNPKYGAHRPDGQ